MIIPRRLVITITSLVVGAVLAMVLSVTISSCTATDKGNTQTRLNYETVSFNQPIRPIAWSSRRFELLTYQLEVLPKPRLRTCSMVAPRGSGANSDIIGIFNSYGFPVNLSNQVTDPKMPEPDGIYVGQSDQTVAVFRNGHAFVGESDINAIDGDCNPALKPNTVMQRQIDYIENLPDTDTLFLPPEVVPTPSAR